MKNDANLKTNGILAIVTRKVKDPLRRKIHICNPERAAQFAAELDALKEQLIAFHNLDRVKIGRLAAARLAEFPNPDFASKTPIV